MNYDRVNPGVITGRMTPDIIDNEYVANQMRQHAAATNDALVDQSGGNRAIAQAALLMSNRGSQGAIADAMMRGRAYNAQQRQTATQFNTGVEAQNIGNDMNAQAINSRMKLTVDDMNARNRAARTNAINHYLSQIGTQLGNIGTENRWMNIAPVLGQGYDSYGRMRKCGGKLYKKTIK